MMMIDGDDVIATSVCGVSGLSTRQNGPGIDNKLSVKQAGSSSSTYYHLDHLGTTTGTSTAAGALSPYPATDSYGNGGYNFTGREYDSFTELYYYRARMYDPQLGRFTSEDPIGFAGGDINIYAYVNNRPNALRDPTGTHGTIGLGTAAGMAFLLATSASPVNAPSRCDPVYFPDNPLLANAAMGQALGMAGGYLYGRFISPYVGRLMAGMGDDIIALGLPKGPATAPATPPLQPIPVTLPTGPGVYRASTTGDDYIGQSATLATRTNGHYSPKGKLFSIWTNGRGIFRDAWFNQART